MIIHIACVCVQLLSHVCLFATPWTIACQAPLSMGFSRQEYWSGLPFPSLSQDKESEVAQLCPTLRPNGLQPTRLLRPWNFPGKSTGLGCHFLLQGIFPTQGLNPGLLHCRQTLYHLSHLSVSHLSNPRNGPSVVCCEAMFSFLSSCFINAVGRVGKHA